MNYKEKHMTMKNFELAFDSRTGSCARQCECGKQFYNPDPSWDFEEDELESYKKDPAAISLNCSVGGISFEGAEYVYECDCWKERADKVMKFIDGHAYEIAEYLILEKKRRTSDAEASPVVK